MFDSKLRSFLEKNMKTVEKLKSNLFEIFVKNMKIWIHYEIKRFMGIFGWVEIQIWEKKKAYEFLKNKAFWWFLKKKAFQFTRKKAFWVFKEELLL